MSNKVWFITGTSRGFGRIWAEAALKRGDRVTATARKLEDIADLKERFGDLVLPLQLDVTDRERVTQVVNQAFEHFGRLDVLVNKAGYSLIATAEEATYEQMQAVFEANYFGAVRILRAALPLLRQQGSGHILGVTSSLGLTPMPMIGFYSASKAAAEALHETLAKEIAQFGIKVTMIEPGAYATDFGKSATRAEGMAIYGDFKQKLMAGLMKLERGNPEATADAVLEVVDAEQPPLRLILGSHALPPSSPFGLCGSVGHMGSLGSSFERSAVNALAASEPARSAIIAIHALARRGRRKVCAAPLLLMQRR